MTALRVATAVLCLFLANALFAAPSAETIVTQIHASSLQLDRGTHVENVTLQAGAATIRLIDGTLFPTTAVGGRAYEAVFTGRGSIAAKPDDPIEAGQMELFTSQRTLDETFTEAIFVVANGATMTLLTKGAPSADVAAKAQAQKIYDAWKGGAERKLLNVEPGLLAAATGDEGADAFFAARLHGTHLGDFDYVVDPSDRGVARFGQFVATSLTEREKRRLAGRLDREHRRGRHLGTDVTDLGYFNVWSALGTSSSNDADFEPELYHIDATIADGAQRLGGRATIDLQALRGNRRVVQLTLDEDLNVSQVTDAAGAPLPFLRAGGHVAVVLPSAPETGKRLSLTVAFDGVMFEKEGRAFRLRNTQYWYPHAGSTDRARYDVTLHWPAGLDLLGAGKRVDGGDRWEKRTLDIPADAYTFELGHFAIETIQAGHVNIRLAFDPEAEDRRQVAKSLQNDVGRRNRQIDFRARGITKAGREEIRQQLRDSLLFYEQLFGPYPLDELTVVTVPRDFSQGLPGFLSLSTEMMTDPGTELQDAFFAPVDRRLVIAHEVAHQWWGDRVGTTTARDRWLSEAMACYAATVYSRQKLDWRNRFQIGFTTRWPSMLLHSEHGSRPVESLGPLVLGDRLVSSRAPEAYGYVTYQKGALVIDMLAHSIGEEKFHAILRDILAHEKSVSTESFLGNVARGSGHDLQSFSRYFVYGTGVPEIEYQTEVRSNQGKWTIHLTGDRVDPWRYRVRVARRVDGKLDVVRETVPVATAPTPTLLVPLQVALEAPASQRGQGIKYAARLIDLSGAHFTKDIDIPWEPKDVVLDRDREVLALLYSKSRNSKEVLLQRGTNLAAAGKLAEAEAAFKEGLAAKPSNELESGLNRFAPVALWMPVGVDLGKGYKEPLLDLQNQLTNSALHLSVARLYIDEGKDGAEELRQASRSLDRDWRELIDDEVALLESRAAVRRGDYKAAYDRISKSVKDDGSDSAEAYALLAVAAKESGQTADLQRALDRARELGVDVSALR